MFGIVSGMNPVVDRFLKQRKEMAVKAAAMVAPPTTTKAKSNSLTALPTKEMDLATICESKPKPKIVREYFTRRVEELVSEM